MPTFAFASADGTRHTVTVAPTGEPGVFAVSVDERRYRAAARRLAAGAWLLTLDGVQIVAHAAADGQTRWAAADGQTAALSVVSPLARRAGAAQPGGRQIVAPMPASVRAVAVAAGDPVTRGQTLVVLEAMKMEQRMTASGDAVVVRVLVVPGATVERGQLLVELGEVE